MHSLVKKERERENNERSSIPEFYGPSWRNGHPGSQIPGRGKTTVSIIRKRANCYYPIFCREEDRCCTHRAFSTLKRSACYASRHYPVQATPRCCNLLIGPSNGPCNDRLNPPCPLRNARVSFSSPPLPSANRREQSRRESRCVHGRRGKGEEKERE